MSFDVYSYTNHGGRSYNEDSVGHKIVGSSGIFVVADGLGGHSFGEVASKCVVDTLVENFDGNYSGNAGNYLSSAIVAANDGIVGIQKEKNETLKSTVVALSIDNGYATWANVGDSRLYYIHRGALTAYTNDHSVAYKKFKGGEITREDLAHDEDQSALLRSVGNPDGVKPELYGNNTPIEAGDAFLLCSDGVWEYLLDDEIVVDLNKSASAKEWAERVLVRLIDRVDGHHDNLSVMTVIVPYDDVRNLPRPEISAIPVTPDERSKYVAAAPVMESVGPAMMPMDAMPQMQGNGMAPQSMNNAPMMQMEEQKKPSKYAIIIVILAALIVVVVVVIIVVLNIRKNKENTAVLEDEAVTEQETISENEVPVLEEQAPEGGQEPAPEGGQNLDPEGGEEPEVDETPVEEQGTSPEEENVPVGEIGRIAEKASVNGFEVGLQEAGN